MVSLLDCPVVKPQEGRAVKFYSGRVGRPTKDESEIEISAEILAEATARRDAKREITQKRAYLKKKYRVCLQRIKQLELRAADLASDIEKLG